MLPSIATEAPFLNARNSDNVTDSFDVSWFYTMTILFQQYRMFVESAERISERRNHLNTFFIALHSLFVSGLSLFKSERSCRRANSSHYVRETTHRWSKPHACWNPQNNDQCINRIQDIEKRYSENRNKLLTIEEVKAIIDDLAAAPMMETWCHLRHDR